MRLNTINNFYYSARRFLCEISFFLKLQLPTTSSHLWWSMIMWEKECIYVCVTGSPCCTVENWQHCKPAMTEKIKIIKKKLQRTQSKANTHTHTLSSHNKIKLLLLLAMCVPCRSSRARDQTCTTATMWAIAVTMLDP